MPESDLKRTVRFYWIVWIVLAFALGVIARGCLKRIGI